MVQAFHKEAGIPAFALCTDLNIYYGVDML